MGSFSSADRFGAETIDRRLDRGTSAAVLHWVKIERATPVHNGGFSSGSRRNEERAPSRDGARWYVCQSRVTER